MSDEGKLFEPRALWDVVKISTQVLTPTTGTFLRRSFLNGSRFAININRLTFCPVGYAMASQTGATVSDFAFENSMAIIQRSQIRVNVPFRRHLSRNTVVTTGLRPKATSFARPLNSPTSSSSLFGISRLKFDKELVLPRLGTISFATTAVPYQPINTNIWATAPQNIKTSVAFHQDGGQLNGAARFRPVAVLDGISPNLFTAFGTSIPATFSKSSPITNVNNWPASGVFSPRLFDQENPSRSGSATVSSISLHIQQITYDDLIGTQTANNGVGVSAVVAPVSASMGCAMKTTSGGSDREWWRPGAPVALVLDTVTPALVYPLNENITLVPGDTLDVELFYPASGAGNTHVHDQMFGISANGYAIIEE